MAEADKVELLDKIKAQGDVVRKLKEAKADKEKVNKQKKISKHILLKVLFPS